MYKYTHFISENIAPEGAKRIGVYDGNNKRVCGIPLGGLTPPDSKNKLYSFGLVSDMHINTTDGGVNSGRFDNALSYFEEQGASFCCHAGDITSIGLWYPISETEGTSYYYPYQFEEFQRICQKHSIPVYGCTGNHESYNGHSIVGTYTDIYGDDSTLVVNNLEKLQEYTGHGITYTITHGNDVFIFVGQSIGERPMTDESLQWLYETLEANRNKRCFVFVHPYISADDSGNPLGLHGIPTFNYWGSARVEAFKSMMAHYKNTMLFHGHSHVRPEVQTIVENVNFSTALGFRSFHIPSSSNSRTVTNGKLTTDGSAFCYLADVYTDCVVMRAYNLLTNEEVPIALYKIDTTLQTVAANTFTDSTGTITT